MQVHFSKIDTLESCPADEPSWMAWLWGCVWHPIRTYRACKNSRFWRGASIVLDGERYRVDRVNHDGSILTLDRPVNPRTPQGSEIFKKLQ